MTRGLNSHLGNWVLFIKLDIVESFDHSICIIKEIPQGCKTRHVTSKHEIHVSELITCTLFDIVREGRWCRIKNTQHHQYPSRRCHTFMAQASKGANYHTAERDLTQTLLHPISIWYFCPQHSKKDQKYYNRISYFVCQLYLNWLLPAVSIAQK